MEIFRGIFESLETALIEQKLHNSKDAFSSIRWINRQRSFLNMSKKGMSPRNSSLPSFLKEHVQIDLVVDIGGGSGWIFNLLQPITQKPLTYFNIELKEMCPTSTLNSRKCVKNSQKNSAMQTMCNLSIHGNQLSV
jgi:hypothetical protein